MTNYIVNHDNSGNWYIKRIKPRKEIQKRVLRLAAEDRIVREASQRTVSRLS
jgi:hypothetical protein